MMNLTNAGLRERHMIVFDGEAWFVRRIASITHDLDRDEKVYYCDQPIGERYATLADVPEVVALRDAARAECLGVPEDLARSGAAMLAKLTVDEKQAFNTFVRIAGNSARAEQREQDAKIADAYDESGVGLSAGVDTGRIWRSNAARAIAAAIRAGGEK